MGPGPALDAFLQEAPDSFIGIGPDGAATPGRYDRVGVVARDRGELRTVRVTNGVRTAALAVWLDEGTSALSLTPRPEWPPLQLIRSRAVDGGWLTVLRFAAPVPVRRVVAELGRQAVWPDHAGQRGVVLEDEATEKVAADPVAPSRLAGSHLRTSVTDPDPVLEVGPLDERVLNPVGFERDVAGPVVELSELDWGRGPTEALVRGVRGHLGVLADLPQATPLLAARVMAGLAMAGVPLVAEEFRPEVAAHLGAEVAATITAAVDLTDPQAREEHSIVLRRAALSTYSSAAWRRRLADLAGVRGAAQPLVSVVLATRRPDLLEHALSQVARQRGVERLELVLAPHGFEPDAALVGELAGVRVVHQPSVSVVMATRRPDLLEHALGQVARQRGVDRLELVLAPHGFEVEPARVRDLAGGAEVVVVPQPEDVLFGDVLHAAAFAADGDVVMKMDDDDWYAPDAVADLLLARAYSGAELVGMPDNLYYLEPTDETLRLPMPTEVYRSWVAGGTMLLDRGLLHEVGGFRSVRRSVDAQLIAAVRAAGGTTYRTHGLGYVLRRSDTGHTWQADLDDVRARAAESRPGFAPGRLLEL